MSAPPRVTIVGAGLAGCEAALQLTSRGIAVRLLEQKPLARTAAQSTDRACELVCSNSLRGAALANAVGLLKEEMRRLGSFILRAADATRVPAGGALAVDRERFSALVEAWLAAEPLLERVPEVVERVPDARPCIVATGPLTGDALAADLERRIGGSRLAYYDAIAPIVAAESIDWERVFFASRWDKGTSDEDRQAYVNCPLDREQYVRFVEALLAAEKVAPTAHEPARYFEGCLPIETMAERGVETLAFGPMKPVGLTDPRTGRWPHAVVQLRREDAAGTAWNLVGFQTRMLRGEQERVFRLIPGLERAEIERYGAVHRNTFLDAPALLDDTLALRGEPGLYFAGQLAGTEGYVESAACGWLAAWFLGERLAGRETTAPPGTTAHGAILAHLRTPSADYQPSNVIFAHFAPWDGARLRKRARHEAMAERALADLEAWKARVAPWLPAAPAPRVGGLG
ncbi:MAG: methylenetetrahydrofolate--tRNA-(uracil(54)-C(5))-methyltransferase (FADH(2)-oxidizing) TrmFO [Polyangiaceae bacterium]|nr:methylenetetrahydrofolate--tRNA-(uracil(54)-C(5))-methyltransferase (FADH(2)-oxidizing) TrmFO [Polyangiaceae bacterium]